MRFDKPVHNITMAQDLRKLRQTGTLKEYTRAYKELRLHAPPTMVFDSPTMCVNYLDVLKPYITRQVNFSRCKSLQATYKETKNAFSKADSLLCSQRDTEKTPLVVNLKEAKGATVTAEPSPKRDPPRLTLQEAPAREIAPHSTDAPDSVLPRRRNYSNREKRRGTSKRVTGSQQQPIWHIQKPPPRRRNITVMKVSSGDPLLYAQALSSNKLMSYPFRLRSLTGSVLLNTGADCSLVNTGFARLAKLTLSPSRVRQIKVVDGRTLWYPTRRYRLPSPWEPLPAPYKHPSRRWKGLTSS